MKRRLFTFALAALTIGLLGSCSKINERIDGLDKRVYDLENAKIASIENQIAAINASIADLGAIRQDILDLQVAVGAKGEDIAELKAADEALGKRIDELQTYVDTKLAKYATTEWANATFATLEQLKTTNTELGALKETVGKLGETFDGNLADLKTELTNAINTAVSNLETRISALEARVSALEQMIQSVNITPAYSDGSVEAVDGILTLKCIVTPAEALIGMESLKDSLLIYADSVKVKTKATTPAYMTIEVSEASVLDAAQGAITLTADISEYLPKGEDKALTVAVNIKNGISDFTTEFVPVYATKTTFKAVYNTNGGANTLTFYYDAVDHKGDNSNITVYDNLPTAATNRNAWGYNSIRGSVKSVVIDSSVAGYDALTSTAYMFQNMTSATDISGAEHLDVSNVTDMSLMFQYFGGGPDSNPTTINVVPDVSNWNTGNVTNMNQMFLGYGYKSETLNTVPNVSNWNTCNVEIMKHMFMEYGHKSTTLNTVPDVSNWNTGKVTNMYQMFNGYGYTSSNISCVLDLSGWDLSKITESHGDDVFNFTPKTFKVTIPAKTGEKSNEGGKWYYGDGTKHIAPPTGKTFTLEYVEIGGVKWATMNLGAEKVTDSGDYFAWGATELAYSSFISKTFTFVDSRPASYGGSGWTKNSGFAEVNAPYFNGPNTLTKYNDSDSKTVLESGDDAATALLGSGWRMPTKDDFISLANACNEGGYTIGSITLDDSHKNISTAVDVTAKGIYFCNNYEASDGVKGLLFCDGTNRLFFPAAGRGKGTSIYEGANGFYWSSSLITSSLFAAYYLFFKSGTVNPTSNFSRHSGMLVRPVKAAASVQ